MKKNQKKMVSFTDHLDKYYGKRGEKKREEFEQGFETFKLGIMMKDLRKSRGLTQEQLASKCGTTKHYISRIENNASDIRISTLIRILHDGLGAHLRLNIDP